MSTSSVFRAKGSRRFLFRRQLGSGAMGEVYEAYDCERDELVAVKTLSRLNPTTLYRLKQEFRALADLAHPHLASLYELVEDGNRWFLAMELVDGIDFVTYVRRETGTYFSSLGDRFSTSTPTMELPRKGVAPSRLNQLRSALHQLADGHSALHAGGKIHRDVKPSNVLVERSGRVVILDFGLVADFSTGRPRERTDDSIAGTPAYMAPEQLAGDEITPASDWYGVGLMLYEALTGGVPLLEGCNSWLELKRMRSQGEPPPPAEVVPGVPNDLNDLCVGLLRCTAGKRLSGDDIRKALHIGIESPGAGARLEIASRAPTAPFVGRSRQMAVLLDSFRTVQRGTPAIVHVRGTSGMGKTALVHEFLSSLSLQNDVVVLEGRCYERESVPYKAVDSLVDALTHYLRRLPEAEVEILLPRNVWALARAFPVLECVAAIANAPRREISSLDAQEIRRRLSEALYGLLARMSDRRPLVVFIDDLQWGDRDSARLLGEILAHVDPPALMLICCHRLEDCSAVEDFRELLDPQPAGQLTESVTEIDVDALPLPEAEELVVQLVGRDAPQVRAQANAIARESAGCPFFIQELARFLKNESSSQALTIEGLLKARFASLPKDALRLLEVIAVAGGPVHRSVLRGAAGMASDEHRWLAFLRTARLVRARGEPKENEVETYHDRVREAVVGALSEESRRAIHHALAIQLLLEGPSDPETVAEHFLAAGNREEARKYAIRAAEQAARAFAFERAARLFRGALGLQAADPVEKSTLLSNLGDALANLGRAREAADVYVEAADMAGPKIALELRRRAAEQFLISGHIDRGEAVLESVLAEVGMKLARGPRSALLSLLTRRAKSRLRGLHFVERDVGNLPPDELTRIDICWSVSVGLALVDNIRAADFQTRHLLLALNAGEPYRVARALAVEAGFVSTRGKSESWVRDLLSNAEELAQRIGSPHALGLCSVIDGIAAFYSGEWAQALKSSESAEKILVEQCHGATWELNTARLYQIVSLFYLGELAELSRRVERFLAEALDRGNLYAATVFRTGLANLRWVARGDVENARRVHEEALARWSRRGFHVEHYLGMLSQGQFLLYDGAYDDAWRNMERDWRGLEGSMLMRIQNVRVVMTHLRARCAIAAVHDTGRDRHLLRIARRDAGRLSKEGRPWCNGLAGLTHAALASVCGDDRDAIELLGQATDLFDRSRMPLYATVSRRFLGELTGGDEGKAMVKAADAWMIGHGIGEPERFAHMLAPGF